MIADLQRLSRIHGATGDFDAGAASSGCTPLPTPFRAPSGAPRSRCPRRCARPLRRTIFPLGLAAAIAGAAGCGAPPAALEVDRVGFSAEEIRGLSADQLGTLARIAAVGIAVADDTPESLGRPILERRRREALVQRLREEVALERAGVTEAQLDARYATLPEWELEVRHLVVLSERWRSEEHRAEARRRAAAARERALAGEPFPEVAGDVSEEPGARERGGLLGPGREGTWVREFWEAASLLEPGGISPVVETEYGFHVLFLEDRREIPFAEVRDRVAARVAASVDRASEWDAQVEAWLAGRELHPERMTLPPSEGDDAQVVARDSARLQILVERAEARGLEVPAAELARIEREWERTVAGWGGIFGFEPGLSVDQIRERALAALADPGQNARIAREELARVAPAIERTYPARTPGRER